MFSVVNKIQVYQVCKSLHSVFFIFTHFLNFFRFGFVYLGLCLCAGTIFKAQIDFENVILIMTYLLSHNTYRQYLCV